MANLTITPIDIGNVILNNAQFNDNLLTFAGAGEVISGTILARSTATGNLVPFVAGGTTAGNGIPSAVLTYDVVAAAAGSVSIRAMVAGEVNAQRLVIDADGDASNVTNAIRDQLRSVSIIPVDVTELNQYDNQ